MITIYVWPNFKSAKELKEAVKRGDVVTVFQPGIGELPDPSVPTDVYLEGPHYPAMHKWYAKATVFKHQVQKIWK